MEAVRTTAKYRGGINVLCNEVFPVRIPSCDLFVAAECDQMPVSFHVYTFTLIEFGVVFRRNDLKRIFPIQLQVSEKTVGKNRRKIMHFSSLTYTAFGIDFDSATWRCLFGFHCKINDMQYTFRFGCH